MYFEAELARLTDAVRAPDAKKKEKHTPHPDSPRTQSQAGSNSHAGLSSVLRVASPNPSRYSSQHTATTGSSTKPATPRSDPTPGRPLSLLFLRTRLRTTHSLPILNLYDTRTPLPLKRIDCGDGDSGRMYLWLGHEVEDEEEELVNRKGEKTETAGEEVKKRKGRAPWSSYSDGCGAAAKTTGWISGGKRKGADAHLADEEEQPPRVESEVLGHVPSARRAPRREEMGVEIGERGYSKLEKEAERERA
ncbi:hypothetical protein B0H19DRAFT_1351306 [Mycena capillaripes]|nr:hypothetical protein B0H19DRAFT_1351306 [Mycena capillaripes]